MKAQRRNNYYWIFILLFPLFCFSQKIQYYSNGLEGIVKILKKEDSTIFFCNSKARPYVNKEAIDTIIKRNQEGKIKQGNVIFILSKARIFGFIEITKSKYKAKVINIIYKKVEYANGSVEIYRKNNKSKKNKK
jgi:hypothetical protein